MPTSLGYLILRLTALAAIITSLLNLMNTVRPATAPETSSINGMMIELACGLTLALVICYIISNIIQFARGKPYLYSWIIVIVMLSFNAYLANLSMGSTIWSQTAPTASDTDKQWLTGIMILNVVAISYDLFLLPFMATSEKTLPDTDFSFDAFTKSLGGGGNETPSKKKKTK